MSKYQGMQALDVVDTITKGDVRKLFIEEGKSIARVAVACAFYVDRTARTITVAADDCGMPRATFGMRVNQGRAILAYGPNVTPDRAARIASVIAWGGSGMDLRKALDSAPATVKARDAIVAQALADAKQAKQAPRDPQPPAPDADDVTPAAPVADDVDAPTAPAMTDQRRLDGAGMLLAGVTMAAPTPEALAALSAIVAHAARIAKVWNVTPADLAAAAV